MVYLLRHAHADSQKRWPGPDHDRPLSLRGKEQAIGLLVTLRDQPVTRILSSPTVRCRHTVLPLSHQRGVPIELASSLAVQAPVERLLELVLDPAMQAAVLCGHGEQLRSLLQLLMGRVSLGGPLRLEKGSIWILDPGAGTVGAAHYVPPLRRQRLPALPRLTPAEAGWARMLRMPPAPAARKPAGGKYHPLGGAAAVGALLGVAVLALTLAGVPVLAWTLLGAVATTALVDIARTAAGRQSPSLPERLTQRRLGGA